ncbi:hypothetical protein GCM10010387_15940 [Streptomyces inusitatus]|uniref:SWIM-type domain-containing protein n=1 Tax=Streptomyces inusitatus TaxID=68221 RepID=A0A918UN22_9ACTN|nr:hypothetical protein [Streptomyces inusitatus]GGZ23555.1 hypothetical protein GCM10010387_15940 [Streptomyces inusitatus]
MSATEPARCLKCHRILRCPSPDGYGPKCRAKVRRARANATGHHAWQVTKAVELLELGALVPLRRHRSRTQIFLTVSDDGSEVYRTAASGQCNCPAGLRGTRCYHVAAAAIVAAA